MLLKRVEKIENFRHVMTIYHHSEGIGQKSRMDPVERALEIKKRLEELETEKSNLLRELKSIELGDSPPLLGSKRRDKAPESN